MKITLATGSMSPQDWRDALANAFAAANLEVDLQLWNGLPIGARYATH